MINHADIAITLLKSTTHYVTKRTESEPFKAAYIDIMKQYISLLETTAHGFKETYEAFDRMHWYTHINDHIDRYGTNMLWFRVSNKSHQGALLAKEHARDVMKSIYVRFIVGGEETEFKYLARNCHHVYIDENIFD